MKTPSQKNPEPKKWIPKPYHRIWHRQQEILKEEHGIVWYPPSRMNPRMIYD
jgi:hypothetical protein